MKTLISVIKNNYIYRWQVLELAKANQKKNYKGSDLGILWAFVRPLMYTLVFYTAISLGLRSAKNVDGLYCSYFVWLVVGMLSWFYMSGMIMSGAACFKRYRGVIRNMKFPIETVPTIIALSNLLIHIAIIALALIVMAICGVTPSIYWIQIPIYTALMFVFWVFYSFATGVLTVISKDFFNFIKSISQAIFWLSGIIFDIHKIGNAKIEAIFWFNPITYIAEGYRNSVCRHIWIWEQPIQLGCYLLMLALMAVIGMYLFKKLRKTIYDIV